MQQSMPYWEVNIIFTTLFVTLCATAGFLYAHFDNIMKKNNQQMEFVKELILTEKNTLNKKIIRVEEELEKKLQQHSQWLSKEIHRMELFIEKLHTKIDDHEIDIKKELTHIHEILHNLDETCCNNAMDIDKLIKAPIREKEKLEKERERLEKEKEHLRSLQGCL
jgi:hypothetical protein